MTAPKRIQRKRTAGWRLPEGAVIVDRTTIYGNPFTATGALEAGYAATPADARALCVREHRAWLAGVGQDVVLSGKRQFDRRVVLAHLDDLRGQDLACPCPPPADGEPDICHAVTLMSAANGARAWAAK